MKTATLLAASALLLSSMATAAPVYQCIDASGRRIYSQTANKNCTPAKLGQAGFYVSSTPPAPPAPAPSDAPPPASATAAANPSANIQAAQQRLTEAKRNLEAGKQVRYGNERNYAKYLQRIAGLEAAVQQSERELQQLQANGDAAQ